MCCTAPRWQTSAPIRTEQYEATRDRMLATERAEVTRALDESGVPWSYHGGESVGARLLRCQSRPVLVVPEIVDLIS